MLHIRKLPIDIQGELLSMFCMLMNNLRLAYVRPPAASPGMPTSIPWEQEPSARGNGSATGMAPDKSPAKAGVLERFWGSRCVSAAVPTKPLRNRGFSPGPGARLFLPSRTRPSRGHHRSLTVAPLIPDQRYYGETPAGLRRSYGGVSGPQGTLLPHFTEKRALLNSGITKQERAT